LINQIYYHTLLLLSWNWFMCIRTVPYDTHESVWTQQQQRMVVRYCTIHMNQFQLNNKSIR